MMKHHNWIKKRNIANAVVLLAACVVLLAFGACTAYYISAASKTNSITVGENVSGISEAYVPPDQLKEGADYGKTVSVKNTGTVPCYVRIFAGTEDPIIAAGLDIDWNLTDWTQKQEDGYYYYKEVLTPGQTTAPLFTKLHAKKDLQELNLIVYEDTVQAEGHTTPTAAFASY